MVRLGVNEHPNLFSGGFVSRPSVEGKEMGDWYNYTQEMGPEDLKIQNERRLQDFLQSRFADQYAAYATEIYLLQDLEAYREFTKVSGRYVVLLNQQNYIQEACYVETAGPEKVEVQEISQELSSRIGAFSTGTAVPVNVRSAGMSEFRLRRFNFNQIRNLEDNDPFKVLFLSHIDPSQDYRFTPWFSEERENKIAQIAAALAEQNILLNENLSQMTFNASKEMRRIMLSILDDVEAPELKALLERDAVSQQLYPAKAIGDGNCLFHAVSANLIYNLYQQPVAPEFLDAVQRHLMPFIKAEAEAEALGLMNLEDDPAAAFLALMQSYPLYPAVDSDQPLQAIENCNFAALSSQIVMPALRAMVIDKKDLPTVQAKAWKVLVEKFANAAGDQIDEAFKVDLRNEDPDNIDQSQRIYDYFFETYSRLGDFAGPVEEAVLSEVLAVNIYHVDPNNGNLSRFDDEAIELEDAKPPFYLSKRGDHFTSALGLHPDHGELSAENQEIALAVQAQFNLTHGAAAQGLRDQLPGTVAEPAIAQNFEADSRPSDYSNQGIRTAFFAHYPEVRQWTVEDQRKIDELCGQLENLASNPDQTEDKIKKILQKIAKLDEKLAATLQRGEFSSPSLRS